MKHQMQSLDERELHFKAVGQKGARIHALGPDNSPLRYSRVRPVTLSAGERIRVGTRDEESVVVLLRGEIRVESEMLGAETLGPRRSFITELAHAVYLAPGDQADLVAAEACELMIASAMVAPTADLVSKWVRPKRQETKQVGQANWSRRVTPILDSDFPARVLVVGETVNPPGNWSSSPPHKHDGEYPGESCLEESYYYRLEPSQGFGVQMIYTADGKIDAAMTVRNGDIVVIPRGYHPVVAGPGYHLYYLWVLAGEDRTLSWYEDPEHAWVNKNVR